MPSYSERGRREGTACADLSLAALSAFPACLLSSSRHSWSSPPAIVPSVHLSPGLSSGHPPIRPSGHPSGLLSVLISPRSPRLFPGSRSQQCPTRGLHSGAVHPPSLSDFSCAPARQAFPGGLPEILPGDSSPRLFPKNCAGALFQNRLACRSPSARLPPASCRLTLAIPAKRRFPMDVFTDVFMELLMGCFRNACSGSCASVSVPPALHPVALWHCAQLSVDKGPGPFLPSGRQGLFFPATTSLLTSLSHRRSP